jgi:hypothetical protein
MAIDYTDLPTMKKYMGLTRVDAEGDEQLQDAIAAASREVDRRTNRHFGKSEEPSERVFTARRGVVFVDDIVVSDDIESSHSGTFFPRNGVVDGQEGFPYTRMDDDSLVEGDEVTITAVWGWEEVPGAIATVTKKIAAKFYMDKNAPLGVQGMDDFGMIRSGDHMDIVQRLRLYTRYYYLVG